MMSVVLNILTAIVFYFIGRYSRTDEIERQVESIRSKIKKKPKAGVIPFKTPEEFRLEMNGDKDLEREWKKPGGIGELIKS